MPVRELSGNGVRPISEVIVEHSREGKGWRIGGHSVLAEVPQHYSIYGRQDAGLIQVAEHPVDPVGGLANVLQNEDGIIPLRCKLSAKYVDEH